MKISTAFVTKKLNETTIQNSKITALQGSNFDLYFQDEIQLNLFKRKIDELGFSLSLTQVREIEGDVSEPSLTLVIQSKDKSGKVRYNNKYVPVMNVPIEFFTDGSKLFKWLVLQTDEWLLKEVDEKQSSNYYRSLLRFADY